jgi:hypothetical protein
LYTTPVIYLYLDRLRVKLHEWTAGISLGKDLSADA